MQEHECVHVTQDRCAGKRCNAEGETPCERQTTYRTVEERNESECEAWNKTHRCFDPQDPDFGEATYRAAQEFYQCQFRGPRPPIE